MARPIMIQGTASGVGKTVLTIALCRIFRQDGYAVAPFKSQNMTRNTALAPNGEEIAVSQILQARAADVEPCALMNPIVLKPSTNEEGTRIILNGRPYATINAYNYKDIKRGLIPEIEGAYAALAARHDIIVIEGAGSPVELNLNNCDIVNMGLARLMSSPVLLVADIDRGGVFASLYGTVKLFDEEQLRYVKATIVNRFKGDMAYFAEGAAILERITGLPVAGVVPYVAHSLPEEDGADNDDCELRRDYESQFDAIADCVRKALNMDLIYQIINDGV